MAMQTYSVLIAWDDNDSEQGDFGWTGRARDMVHAEKRARAAMKECHLQNYQEPGQSISDCCEGYMNDDGTFGGSVLEITEGAMWKGGELETALRGLLTWARRRKITGKEWEKARAVIASIHADNP